MCAAPAPLVTSLSNPRLKEVAALRLKKHRNEHGLFVAEGLQQLGMAVAAGWQVETLIQQEGVHHPVLAEVQSAAHSVLTVPAEVLAKLSQRDNPPQAIGVFQQRLTALKKVALAPGSVWLVLEELRDPGNVGTLIRTTDAVGAAGVLVLEPSADVWAPECVRASMGSIFHLPMVQTRRADFLAWWEAQTAEQPVALVGAHLQGAVDYRAMTSTRPLLLALGTEQRGLSRALSDACTQLVKIAQPGRAESLNVAVAGAVLLYEARRGTI